MAENTLKIVPRSGWNARPPRKTEPMIHPIELVSFSYTDARNILDIETIKHVQNLNMDGQDMDDIKCNFIVGRDGTVFEGRGWLVRPHESVHEEFDNNFLEVLIVSTLKGGKPDPVIYKAINKLMDLGKRLNYMNEQYMVFGNTKYGEAGVETVRKPVDKL